MKAVHLMASAFRELRVQWGKALVSIVALVIGILAIVAVEAASIAATEVFTRKAELEKGRSGLVNFAIPATPGVYRQAARLHAALPEDVVVVWEPDAQPGAGMHLVGLLGNAALWKPFALASGTLDTPFANLAGLRLLQRDCAVLKGPKFQGRCPQVGGVVLDGDAIEGWLYLPMTILDEPKGGSLRVFYRARTADPLGETVRLAAAVGLKGAEGASVIDVRKDLEPVIRVVRQALLAAGLVTLGVGVLGVLNIGLATLNSRTTELALRRCLGATKTEISGLVMCDAIIVGFIGSAVALTVAVTGYSALMVALIGETPSVFPVSAVVVGVLVGVGAGIVGGLVPAFKAGRIQLSEVMRG